MRKFIILMCCVQCCTGMCGIVKSMLGSAGNMFDDSQSPDVVQVQYLQATGTQYILLNSIINGLDGWILPGDNNNYGAVGIWNGGARSDSIKWTTLHNRGWIMYAASNNAAVYTFDMNYEFTRVIVDGTSFTVDGTTYQCPSAWGRYFTGFPYFALFGCYHTKNGEVSTQSCKIGLLKLYSHNELLYDFIPVRFRNENNTWEGGMYDTVSETIFRNQGSGSFIVGPDL